MEAESGSLGSDTPVEAVPESVARGTAGGRLTRHGLFVAFFLAGASLRVLAWIGYQPALLYGDSFRYLDNIGVHDPTGLHPIGYDLFVLEPIIAVAGLATVAALQHLVALAAAVALYALTLRHGARPWLAAVAAAPLLLDAYQVQIEQMIMSDTWQQVLLVALLWVLLARGAPGPRRAALAGLLLGVAVLLRLVAVSLVVPAVVYLVIAGGLWRRLGPGPGLRRAVARSSALLAVFAVIVGGYAAYYQSWTGQWGLSRTGGDALYGRTAVVADCAQLRVSDMVRLACPDEPAGQRKGIDYYAHIAGFNPGWLERFPEGTDVEAVQKEFGWAVVRAQPLDVATAVAVDFLKGFRPTRSDSPGDVGVQRWQFAPDYQYYAHRDQSIEYSQRFSGREPSGIPPVDKFLRGYQLSGGYTPGTVLGVLGVVALVAGFGIGRARTSDIRSATLLAVGMAVTILLASAVFEFSWRYQLPGLVLLPFAGALGMTALLGRTRPSPDRLSQSS